MPLILVLYSVVEKAYLVSHLAARPFAVNMLNASAFVSASYHHRWDPFGIGITFASRQQQAALPSCIREAISSQCEREWCELTTGSRVQKSDWNSGNSEENICGVENEGQVFKGDIFVVWRKRHSVLYIVCNDLNL